MVSTGLQVEVCLHNCILLSEKQIRPLVHGSSVTNCNLRIHFPSPDLCCSRDSELELDELELELDFPALILFSRLICLSREFNFSSDSDDSLVDDDEDCDLLPSPEIDG